jgi:hypothetical protein
MPKHFAVYQNPQLSSFFMPPAEQKFEDEPKEKEKVDRNPLQLARDEVHAATNEVISAYENVFDASGVPSFPTFWKDIHIRLRHAERTLFSARLKLEAILKEYNRLFEAKKNREAGFEAKCQAAKQRLQNARRT